MSNRPASLDEWDSFSIKEILSAPLRDFGSFSLTNLIEFVEDGVPFIKSESVKQGFIEKKNISFINPDVHKKLHKSVVRKGDILYTKIGALGRVAIYDGSLGECNSNAATVKINVDESKVDPVYFCYILMSEPTFREFEKNIISTPPRINLGDISALKLNFPPLENQKKIALVLSTVDNLIDQTQNLIDKYTAVKQGMMADLFSRGIDLSGKADTNENYGQLRPSFEDAPELYQETELGWVPKDWEVVKIDDISTQMTNGFVGVATPHYANENEVGIRYLYGNNVRADKLELDTVLKIKPEFHQKLQKSQLKHGDMLTVQSGHIGTTAIVPENFGEANCHALIITRLIQSKILPEFLSFYLNSAIGMNRMEEIFVGSTIKHVNVKELKSFLVPLPSIGEQKSALDKIIGARKLIDDETRYLEKLKLKKKGLMQDLLTGKVKVN
ncbi:restriction endonuclease subunit S [Colwellia sp. 1_MG-2023]|uniref:restriction endonuclease subunit S n=1 Tax=Colwellia sp. 1_MG-2023 TaxID=3062649 RepID=UPI0026E2C4CA|nr:restriction endonuclease subunit S [Colwellia sp. 1_MG-2023]MDO6444196.1 restriction endonuclease subunit S [Colwellia sp. 1_MG-2023]